jgi:hypothetical protein
VGHPSLGRFLNEDPLRFSAGGDFYTYVENGPTNYTDPFGLQAAPATAPSNSPTTGSAGGGGLQLIQGGGGRGVGLGGRLLGLLGRFPIPALAIGPANPNLGPQALSVILQYHSWRARQKCKDNGCRPCVPPVGTISYRQDTSGPPHRGVPTPHWHLFVMQQSPAPDCQCQWVRIKDIQGGFGGGNPPPGTVPKVDPIGGGGVL